MDKRHKLLLCNLILCACLFVFALVTIVMASSALTSKRRLIAALILVYFFAVAIIRPISAEVMATGFSLIAWYPASSAAQTYGQWN